MIAYLLDTETDRFFQLQYLPSEIGWSREVRYDSASVPQSVIDPIAWSGTSGRTYSLSNLFLDGDGTPSAIALLEQLQNPIAGKNSPPVCVLQLGSLAPVNVVVRSITVSLSSDRFNEAGQPTRARIGMTIEQVADSVLAV